HRHVPDIYLPGLLRGSQPRGNRRQHITQKPVEIMRELVKITPEGGTVLDPCMASATTGVAALEEGRRFLGFATTEQSAANARAGLSAVQPLLTCPRARRSHRPRPRRRAHPLRPGSALGGSREPGRSAY